ncbi:MAG: hypothetical protein LUQ35_03005 [Methanoregula sp.]|jgi:hypothetical protein|nr:hypothetical protein [Methanoregula sp.]
MKKFFTITTFSILFFGLIFAGCTNSFLPAQTPVSSNALTVPSTVLTAIPTAEPYPNALGLDEYSCFGCDNRQAGATVYRYEIRPYYNWTSPSWNSPREQAAASQPLELQGGYTMEKPHEGNTFLFIFIRVENVGTLGVNVPLAKQFVVYSGGNMYNYTPVHSPDVIIDRVSGSQYGYQTGQEGSGTVGYIQSGESNRAEGYLIYEIPASFSPNTTYVIANLDNQNKAEWILG